MEGRQGTGKAVRMTDEFLILSQRDLREVMTFADYVEAVTEAFQLLAQGRCQSPVPIEIPPNRAPFTSKPGACLAGSAMWPPRSTAISLETRPCMDCQQFRVPCSWQMRATVVRWRCWTRWRSRPNVQEPPQRSQRGIWHARLCDGDYLRLRRTGPDPADCAATRACHSSRFRLGHRSAGFTCLRCADGGGNRDRCAPGRGSGRGCPCQRCYGAQHHRRSAVSRYPGRTSRNIRGCG